MLVNVPLLAKEFWVIVPLLTEVPVPAVIEPFPRIVELVLLARPAVIVPLLVNVPLLATKFCWMDAVFVTVLLKVVLPVSVMFLLRVPPLKDTEAELAKLMFNESALANATEPPVMLKLFEILDPLLMVCVPPVKDKLPPVAKIVPESMLSLSELMVTLPPVCISVAPDPRVKLAPLLI